MEDSNTRGRIFISSLIFYLVSFICMASQNAQFVIDYSTFDDAYISDAVIAASYLLNDTKDKVTVKSAMKVFQDNKIDLKFKFCKNTELEKCISEKKMDRLLLSYVFFKALKLRGGITTRVFGVAPKYTYNELIYLGFFRGGFSGQYVTKLEVLNTLTSALEYVEKFRKKKNGVKK